MTDRYPQVSTSKPRAGFTSLASAVFGGTGGRCGVLWFGYVWARNVWWTNCVGEFGWGGKLLYGNGSFLRSAQGRQKRPVEHKGKSRLNLHF